MTTSCPVVIADVTPTWAIGEGWLIHSAEPVPTLASLGSRNGPHLQAASSQGGVPCPGKRAPSGWSEPPPYAATRVHAGIVLLLHSHRTGRVSHYQSWCRRPIPITDVVLYYAVGFVWGMIVWII